MSRNNSLTPRRRGGSGSNSAGESPQQLELKEHPGHAESLCVLDMGLDFKTYTHIKSPGGASALTNMFTYSISAVSQLFVPTCGLLTTVLHQAISSKTPELAAMWLEQFVLLEKQYIRTFGGARSPQSENPHNAHSPGSRDNHNPVEGKRCADESIRLATSPQKGGSNQEILANINRLCHQLLVLLDRQSGYRGENAPSRRKIATDSRIAHCNLDLTGAICHQGFLCNQLHQVVNDRSHRDFFFRQLIDLLVKEKYAEGDIHHRVKDALLFAAHGNRVTVFSNGSNVLFFKTSYTRGRLLHALKLPGATPCPNPGHCHDQNCTGVHAAGSGGGRGGGRPMELGGADKISKELDQQAQDLVASVLSPPKVPVSASPASPPSSVETKTPESLGNGNGMNNRFDSTDTLVPTIKSPTTRKWDHDMAAFVEENRRPPQATTNLLSILSGTNLDSPLTTSDGITPLLQGINDIRFESASNSMELGAQTRTTSSTAPSNVNAAVFQEQPQ